MRVRLHFTLSDWATHCLSRYRCPYSKRHGFAYHICPFKGPRPASRIEWRGDLFCPCESTWHPFFNQLLSLSQSSVATMFTEEGGWPFGEVRDTDSILEMEKEIEIAEANPVRKVSHACLLYHRIVGMRLLIFYQDQHPCQRTSQSTGCHML